MTSKPMTNKQKIKILNSYQSNPMVHPLTCGNNSYHQNLVPIEENNEVILKCLDCNYTQFLDENFIFVWLNTRDFSHGMKTTLD